MVMRPSMVAKDSSEQGRVIMGSRSRFSSVLSSFVTGNAVLS